MYGTAKLISYEGKPGRILYSLVNIERKKKPSSSLSETIFIWGRTLSRVSAGDLSARIDTAPLSGDIELISEAINSILDSLELNVRKIQQNEASLDNAVKAISEVVSRVARDGDLSARVELDKLSEKHLVIGMDINQMIDSLQSRQEELHKSQEYTTNLIRNVPLPMFVSNPQKTITDVNLTGEKLFKAKKEKICGRKILELFSADDQKKITNAWDKSIKTGFGSCEAVAVIKDKPEFPALLNFASIKDDKNELVEVLITTTDVTELRMRESELREAINSLAMVGDELGNLGKTIDSLIKNLRS